MARVPNEQIERVRKLLNNSDATPPEIARDLRIDYDTVLKIKKGEITTSHDSEEKIYTEPTLKAKAKVFKDDYLMWLDDWEGELPEIDLSYEKVKHLDGLIYAKLSQESVQRYTPEDIKEKHETLLTNCLDKVCECGGKVGISLEDFLVSVKDSECTIEPKTLQNYEARGFLTGLYKPILSRKIENIVK